MSGLFEGRSIAIATRHSKEVAIAPVLEKELGVVCVTPPDLDTDAFGTFTGEVERKASALDAARLKCRMAIEATGLDLAVASEGSFGPHPAYPFLPADEELLVLVDIKNGLEIVVREWSMETNFNGSMCSSWAELSAFADKAGFPSHGLILRKSHTDTTAVIKGIVDQQVLESAAERLLRENGNVYVETDMRACFNPMRMRVIRNAAQELSKKMRSSCPECGCPGYGVADVKSGLRCSGCNFPTRSTLKYIHACGRCGHSHEEWYPLGKREEDPMYCDNCNP